MLSIVVDFSIQSIVFFSSLSIKKYLSIAFWMLCVTGISSFEVHAQEIEPIYNYEGYFVSSLEMYTYLSTTPQGAAEGMKEWTALLVKSLNEIRVADGYPPGVTGESSLGQGCDGPDRINGQCSQYFSTSVVNQPGLPPINERWKITTIPSCPRGYSLGLLVNERISCQPDQPEPLCDCEDTNRPDILHSWDWVGNPINPATDVKLQPELDYDGSGSNGLKFVRTYRSDRRGWAHNYLFFGVNLKSPPSNYLTSEQACVVGVGSNNLPYCFHYFHR